MTTRIERLLKAERDEFKQACPAAISDGDAAAIVGLRRLERYAAVPIAGWLEGVFTIEEFADLVGTDVVENIRQCAEYVSKALALSEFRDQLFLTVWASIHHVLNSTSANRAAAEDSLRRLHWVFQASAALRQFAERSAADETLPGADEGLDTSFIARVSTSAAELGVALGLGESRAVMEALASTARVNGWI